MGTTQDMAGGHALTGELSTARELVAAALLAVQVGSVAIAAAVATVRLVGRDPLTRALTWVLLVLAQAVGVPLVLGMVGLLRLPVVVLVHVVVAVAAIEVHRRHPAREAAVEPSPGATTTGWSLLDLVALGATSVYVSLGVLLSLDAQRSFEFDTKEYHLANLSSWLQAGHIWGLPYSQPGSMTANHPSSGEVFGLWLALPSHGDELVYLAPVAFGILAILAGAVLGRELAADRQGASLGALAAVAVMTAPIYFAQVDSLLTDLIAAASVVTAVAFLVLAHRAATPPPALVALAGIALGLGIGSKYTALLPGLAVGLAAVVLLRRSRVWWWLVPGVLVLAAPWYVRNILTTGNPLFPQSIGPIDGARSPYDVLDASMLDHVVDGETDILRRTGTLAREFVGPLLVVMALGIGGALLRVVRGRDRVMVGGVGALAAFGLAIYLATPYTGGGPTGLSFIIVSCFRYALIGVLLAAIAGAALIPRWLAVAVVGLTLAWNAWQIVRDTHTDRPQLDVSVSALVVALVIAVAVVAVAWRATGHPIALDRVPVTAVAAVVLIGSLVGGVGVYHHLDRGRTPTVLEATLLALGPDEPAVVTGVADLRAVLGPRLERPLVKVSRGGAADEIPFTDEAQLRRRILGEAGTTPPPARLSDALDDAIDAAGPDILVTGGVSPTGYPDGWLPTDAWCLAGGDGEGTVFVRAERLPPGVACVTASDL
jgi:hypothetical protein